MLREKFKTGNTIKLQYPFNTSAVLEILTSYGKWHRVTANEFRSFDGPRRINDYITIEESRNITGNRETKEYNGPLYYYGTNTTAIFSNTKTIIHQDKPLINQKPNPNGDQSSRT